VAEVHTSEVPEEEQDGFVFVSVSAYDTSVTGFGPVLFAKEMDERTLQRHR